MSRELIDEVIDTIEVSDQDDFSDILETIVEYGFADGQSLCKLFEVDDSELDELISGSDTLTEKQWIRYTKLLLRYLNKERKKYERLYFSQKP